VRGRGIQKATTAICCQFSCFSVNFQFPRPCDPEGLNPPEILCHGFVSVKDLWCFCLLYFTSFFFISAHMFDLSFCCSFLIPDLRFKMSKQWRNNDGLHFTSLGSSSYQCGVCKALPTLPSAPPRSPSFILASKLDVPRHILAVFPNNLPLGIFSHSLKLTMHGSGDYPPTPCDICLCQSGPTRQPGPKTA
jgi:hypothetical protein